MRRRSVRGGGGSGATGARAVELELEAPLDSRFAASLPSSLARVVNVWWVLLLGVVVSHQDVVGTSAGAGGGAAEGRRCGCSSCGIDAVARRQPPAPRVGCEHLGALAAR